MPLSQPAPFQIDLVGLYWSPPADVEELLVPVERIQVADAPTIVGKSFWAARDALATGTPEGAYGIKTGFVRGPLAAKGVTTMLEWIGALPGVPSLVQESTTVMVVSGGKVNDVAPDANAFVHRNADFLYKCEVIWEPQDDPALIAANLEWLDGYHAAMRPYFSGGAYQNFPDRTQGDWQHAYYGQNFDRLVETKRAWDPDNLFTFEQSIPTEV